LPIPTPPTATYSLIILDTENVVKQTLQNWSTIERKSTLDVTVYNHMNAKNGFWKSLAGISLSFYLDFCYKFE
jgi:hypothetical protein